MLAAPGLAALAPAVASAQSAAPSVEAAPRCLFEDERETALKIGLLSLTPSPICSPAYQVIEIRNDSAAPLGDLRVELTPPLGPGRMRFEPLPGSDEGARRFLEISTDDGASWTPIPPPEGSGGPNDPLVLSGALSPALGRLGPSGGGDDSVLVRWRARLGEAFGSPFASEARLGLTASARDACGRLARGRERLARLSLTRPTLGARLEGRNVTSGGVFGPEVAAAPGDLLEWRVGAENYGEARAAVARVAVGFDPEGTAADALAEPVPAPPPGALDEDPADILPAGGRAIALDGVVPGGRRVALLPGVAGASCAPVALRATPSWGCVVPPEGAPAALAALAGGEASARLLRAPDPNLVAVELAMTGAAGAGRPGDEALVQATLRNDGPPAFEPELAVTLPDGYVFDPAHPIETFSAARGVGGAELSPVAPSEGDETLVAAAAGAVRLRLTGAAGAPARLNQGDAIEVRFRALRVRSSALETDRLSARALFSSGCGEQARSRLSRLEVSPRQSTLSARLTPVGTPILSRPGASARFRAVIANDGEEAADRVLARLELGRGWADANPAPQYCAPEAPDEAERVRRFLCRLEEAARPGGEIAFEFDLVSAAEAFSEPLPERDFGVLLTAEAFGDAGAARVESPIAAARDESGAVALVLNQRMFDAAGRPWPEDRPVNLGEEVALTFRAAWLGAGRERIGEPALYQTLPSTLEILSVEGTQDGKRLRGAVRRDQNQVIWGLDAFESGSVAELTVRARAVDAREQNASVAANAVFVFRGETQGVDATEGGPTFAAPLTRAYRKPDLRFAFEIDGREPASTGGEGPLYPTRAGERLIARLTLANKGAGPGFVDRVRMVVPRGVEIASFTGDGLDNDGDGRRDEADEAHSVEIKDVPEGQSFTWIRLPSRGLAPGAEASGRIDPGATAVWPVALRVLPEAPPGRPLRFGFEADFGARPLDQAGAAGRARLSAATRLAPPPASGVLALTGLREREGAAAAALDRLSRELGHGAVADHRAILRLPPGRHPEARLIALLPPAFSEARIGTLRLGAGLACEGGAKPEIAAAPAWAAEPGGPAAPRRALVWPLGDCVVDPAAPESARTALIDFSVTAEDADPEAAEAARIAWRRPAIALWFERAGLGPEPFRQQTGVSGFTLRGPLLRLSDLAVAHPTDASSAAAAAGFDAGDRFEIRARLANVGDRPATAIDLAATAFGPIDAIDCGETRLMVGDVAAPRIETGDARREPGQDDGAPAGEQGRACGGAAIETPLAPGRSREVRLLGRLGDGAPIGRDHRLELRAAPYDGARPGASTGAAALLPARSVGAPSLALALRGPSAEPEPDAPRLLAIGEAFRLRGVFPYPEGRGEAHLALRFRFLAGVGETERAIPAPSLRLADATLTKERPSALFSADPGGVSTVAPLRAAPVTAAVAEAREMGEWREFDLPLGEILRKNAIDGPADERLTFEATFVLEDAPELRAGMRLEAVGVAYLEGAEAAASPRRALAEIAEPALEIAALTDDADAATGLGERVAFSAEICNRGAAPAFGVRALGALPPGFALPPGERPRFLAAGAPRAATRFALGPAAAAALARRPDFGTATATSPPPPEAGLRVVAEAAEGAAIAPGGCVALRAPAVLRQADGAQATARFSLLGYRSRPENDPGGRAYRGGAAAEAVVRLNTLTIAGPSVVTAGPDGRLEAAFVIAAPAARGPLSLSLEMRGLEGLDWALAEDRDGDGRLGAADPLWRDGAALPRGGRLAVIASARAPRPLSARWRGAATLVAVGVAPDGATASGAQEIALRPGLEDAAAIASLRVMAVDRDCDGDLADETAQDAAFEPVKEAAAGECVAMRLYFSNQGAAAVEDVVVADRPPPGATLIPGSARFLETPPGLIGGEIEQRPSAPSGATTLRFRFVGALSPGGGGVVAYRLRLPTY